MAAAALLIAVSGCSPSDGTPARPAPEPAGVSAQAAYPGDKQGARALMAELAAHGDLALVASLRPTTADYQALFEPAFAERAQRFYEKSLWASMPPTAEPFAKPDQTEVRVWGATTEELRAWGKNTQANFPGGYEKIKDQLRPGLTIYSIDMVVPGEEHGMAYNGLTYVNGHWAFFPKPWRALESEQ
ncbi:hypothetical protein [Micromonospora matsumotoense]|uniref:hypothetical protein n=1 Tax=Micromonospora matsumotoense TaxID=121616 RepID=UPI000B83A986|nr:hypothetical protein [Micromonospora matsumotoense]